MDQKFIKNFNTEYQKLNSEQKLAVDTIEGPVMVIAGAGTGKTQTIALRIANILQKTQTPPGSILCLTFTETGTIAMRERLVSIIGPSAYSVKINTFHAFCNEVIKTNPEYFIFAKNIESIEDLEKIEIIQTLIERLPDGSILKPWGDHFYYQREITSNIQKLKRENITPALFLDLVEGQSKFLDQTKDIYTSLKALKASKSLESEVVNLVSSLLEKSKNFSTINALIDFYQKLYQSGYYVVGAAKNPTVNYKNALIKFFENLVKDIPKQLEFQQVYLQYQSELQNRGLYDFDDMILFVLNQFKISPDLLSDYQEKFQYILVDEYQDTNATQNEVISLLGSYFENPNIFVVGDDDQSIYRFQGAAIENIFDFYKTYQNQINVIVLKNNYRSHQLILDTSQSVISNNKNRITNYIKDLDKSLKSVSTFDPDPINVFEANSTLEENFYVGKKIKQLLEQGINPNQIAILARTHSNIQDIVETLKNLDIKYHLGYGDNILEDVWIQQLLKLLKYLNNPCDDETLFHILSFGFLKINSFDLLKILRFSRHQHIPLSDLICSRSQIEEIKPHLRPSTITRLLNFSLRISKAKKWLSNYSLNAFYNKFIRRFGYLQHVLDQNDIFIINHLNVFYSELKRLSLSKNFSLDQFLKRIDLLTENRLPLSAPELNSEIDGAIRIMTVHGSKGLEFEHVFLIKCADKNWGNNARTSTIRLPYGIIKTEISLLANDDNEEERRLFYVALTRAKNQIYISYSRKNETDHEQNPSIFTAEIDPKLIQIIHADPDIQKEALIASVPLTDATPDLSRQLQKYLKHFLATDYKFNITHLNSYLRCPLCFYYKTILKIPSVKDKYAALGTAIHNSLSYLFDNLKADKKLISEKQLLKIYSKFLLHENLSPMEFSESLNRGNQILSEYYQNYHDSFDCDCLTEFDFAAEHVHLDDIPLTGKIDKVEILKTSKDGVKDVNVVDFKTGNPDTKSKELKEDGEYFRQLVFYKILADSDPSFNYNVVSGTIDFVQKSKYKKNFVKKDFVVTEKQVEDLKKLIKEVYQKILNLEFQKIGDNCPDRNHLHYLLETHETSNQKVR